ncbi:hypothetical protein QTG56_14175 [Rossellomorea sp. AcN35-11]|nr:hypothetical protein QTG56_14175 [Rossellomorea sp. AcN35-11]
MNHSFIDYHKIYQAIQSSISSITGEENETVQLCKKHGKTWIRLSNMKC